MIERADMAIREQLEEIHSALDGALGDSDITHMDDDELREAHPVQWAAAKLAAVIAALKPDDRDK
jgi:hypothetical protein